MRYVLYFGLPQRFSVLAYNNLFEYLMLSEKADYLIMSADINNSDTNIDDGYQKADGNVERSSGPSQIE